MIPVYDGDTIVPDYPGIIPKESSGVPMPTYERNGGGSVLPVLPPQGPAPSGKETIKNGATVETPTTTNGGNGNNGTNKTLMYVAVAVVALIILTQL